MDLSNLKIHPFQISRGERDNLQKQQLSFVQSFYLKQLQVQVEIRG